MAVINYSQMGEPVGDAQAEALALRIGRTFEKDEVHCTSSMVLVRAAQLLVAEARVRDPDVQPPPNALTRHQADKIRFTVEDRDVEVDAFGRIKDPPPLMALHEESLYTRFRGTVAAQIVGLLSDSQKKQIDELHREWFEEQILPLFNPESKFWFSPRQAGMDAIPDFDEAVEATIQGWTATEDGYPVCVTDCGPIPVHLLLVASFDGTGGRMVAKVFNLVSALKQLNMGTATLENPGWTTTQRGAHAPVV